jgi:protein-L-isoaspartate(D-aspartate) O-methyltransferase
MTNGRKAILMAELGRQIRDQRVLDAMARVPREAFLSDEMKPFAYEDAALPTIAGQTISQPLMVALMTEALMLSGEERVLEVGTGSGYQAAVLSQLARHIVTVERVSALVETAKGRMAALGYSNVIVRQAVEDQLGWPADAPYDAIVVTAAAPRVPPSLLAQLADGGRLVVPVGSRDEQALLQVVKGKDGTVSSRHITYCRFVLLLGMDGWPVEAGAGA